MIYFFQSNSFLLKKWCFWYDDRLLFFLWFLSCRFIKISEISFNPRFQKRIYFTLLFVNCENLDIHWNISGKGSRFLYLKLGFGRSFTSLLFLLKVVDGFQRKTLGKHWLINILIKKDIITEFMVYIYYDNQGTLLNYFLDSFDSYFYENHQIDQLQKYLQYKF